MHQIHIAPMMGYTHRHFRYLMRRFCPEVLLYSEMVTTGALLHGDVKRHLDFDTTEAPVVLQQLARPTVVGALCASRSRLWLCSDQFKCRLSIFSCSRRWYWCVCLRSTAAGCLVCSGDGGRCVNSSHCEMSYWCR